MKDSYLQAVLALLNEGKDPKEVVAGLKKTMQLHGHEPLLRSVLKGVIRVLEAGRHDRTKITVARESDAKKHAEAIKRAMSEVGTTAEDSDTIIDETIIGGFVVEANAQIVDASYKHKLLYLYQNLTRI